MKIFFLLLNTLLLPFIIFAQNTTPMGVAGTATKTATTSGNWSSTSTWGGALPANDARVLIPSGITVTVDGMITEAFKSVRIDNGGKLQFATNVNTELRTEYLFSSMTGTLEIGTNANKITTGVTANLVFAERGGTTSIADPQRFAPGAVLMGPTTMHGADKTSWLTLATHPLAGATQFTLKSAPSGWQVGDKLVVAGTEPITNASITSTNEIGSDEVVTITNISGSTISFTPALVRDHKAPAQASDLEVHVANLSRNIIVSSENTSVSSISGDFRKPRGHIMFMHNLNVDLKYVAANNLGRTDKSILLDDWDFEDLDANQNTGSAVPNGGRNPRGRYSFHFHRGGFDTSVFPAKPITPLPSPATVEGCVVNTDPGWGYVNHSSRVNFVRNVSYNVVGGAFNTEAGNETGSFIENIAIRTINPQNPIMSAPRPRASYTEGGPTSSLADLKEGRQDFAWQGDGFWFHGTGITVQDNVVTGCTGHAFVYWTEGLIEKGLGMARGDIDAHVPAAEFPTQNQTLKEWKATYPNFVLDVWYLQPRPFSNNTAYNFARGVQTYYTHTEFHRKIIFDETDPNGWPNDLPPTYKDQLNLIFDGTTLWNIGRVGFEHNHTANVTIQNSRIVGYGARTGFENYGTNPAPAHVNDEPEVIGLDLDFYHNTHRWLLNNNTIEGFSGNAVGITLPKNAQVTINGGTFNNTGTDILVNAPSQHFSTEEGGLGTGMLSTQPTKSEVLIQGTITFQNPTNNIVMDAEIIYDQVSQKGFPLIDGAKTDPLYFFAPQAVILNFGPFSNASAYFNEQDASFIPLTSGASGNGCAISEDWECVASQYLNKTNAQLNAQYNNSFLGTITPNTAVTHPIILGGKVSSIADNPCANSGGDSDNDGICANNDCDDNNANIGAMQAAGTSCNDGNAATENDVIQVDGCTCAGTIAPSTFPIGAKILCLGDSRVQGDTDFDSYRYELWKDLLDCNWNFDLVGTISDPLSYPSYQNTTFDPDHQGIGGHTTSNILQELPEVISSIGSTDFVLLGIGGNDIMETGTAGVSSAISNINSIIDLLQANNPNVIVLLEQIAPALSTEMTPELTTAINSLNSQISVVAANQTNGSSQVIIVDMHTGWQDSYLADDVHYNSTGAAVVAARYSDALKLLYNCNTNTDCDTDIILDTNPTTNITTNAANAITSTVSITSGLDITYKAGQTITLQPGFHAQNGSSFLAHIENCTPTSSRIISEAEMVAEQNNFTPIKPTKAKLKSYPNPVRQVLFIPYEYEGLSTAGRLLIVASDGTIMLDQKTSLQAVATIEVSLAHYPNGMYFYQLISEHEAVGTGRFIKQE